MYTLVDQLYSGLGPCRPSVSSRQPYSSSMTRAHRHSPSAPSVTGKDDEATSAHWSNRRRSNVELRRRTGFMGSDENQQPRRSWLDVIGRPAEMV